MGILEGLKRTFNIAGAKIAVVLEDENSRSIRYSIRKPHSPTGWAESRQETT